MDKEKDYIFGIRAVIEAIKSGKEIDKILIKRGLAGDIYQELFSLVRENKIPFQYVPIEKLNRVTRKNHQGVIAFLSVIIYQDIENIIPALFEQGENPFILILDGITDVRNLGAIARSAECAGVHAIVIPDKGSAQINADAMKTSAGALNYIPVCRSRNLVTTIKYLQNCGLTTVAATEKAKDNYYLHDFQKPLTLVMGSEESGISPEILRIAESWLKVPIVGKIESLNVSAAASILIFEVVRQRIAN